MDERQLRTRLLLEKVRENGGLTPDERALLKLLIDQAQRRVRMMDERVLRGLHEQQAREERSERLAGY